MVALRHSSVRAALLSCWLCVCCGAAKPPRTAVVSVKWPAAFSGNYEGTFAAWAPMPDIETKQLKTFTPPDRHGCSVYPAVTEIPFVALVWSGGPCSARNQTQNAQEAGAEGLALVVVQNKTAPSAHGEKDAALWAADPQFKIFVVGLPESLGDKLDLWNSDQTDDPARLTFEVYASSLFDISEFLMIAMATSLIVLGAFFATADLRVNSPIAPRSAEDVIEVDAWFPIIFCGLGSVMLVVLFFLMRYMIYLIIAGFCIGGGVTLFELLQRTIRYECPCMQRRLCVCRGTAVDGVHLIAAVIASTIVISWFVLRDDPNGWFFQDIIGAAFLCVIQQTLRLPNIKLATALLTLMFCFDIFWVFLSPLLFNHKSVMVEVATGGGTGETVPMLLRIPVINDPLGNQRMLGFGDIALPGLLTAFLRRFDILSGRSWRSGYFLPAVCGYATGMVLTLAALYIMQMGQPALLYLVPCTLGTTLLLAYKRGEVHYLWLGTPHQLRSGLVGNDPACDYCPRGHVMQHTAAEAGVCDGCRKPVLSGQLVMNCHECDVSFCGDCRRVDGADAQDVEDSRVRTEGVEVGQV